MPKSIRPRSSFQSSLAPIPEAGQAHHHTDPNDHELQELSHQKSNKEPQAAAKPKEGEDEHTFHHDGGEGADRDNLTLPGGKKVGFGLVRWWKSNIARVLPMEDDVRDHLGMFC